MKANIWILVKLFQDLVTLFAQQIFIKCLLCIWMERAWDESDKISHSLEIPSLIEVKVVMSVDSERCGEHVLL